MWVAPRKSTSTPSQSSRSTRSTSPARRAQDLRKLQKPVRFTRQSPRNLAATMSSISKGPCDLFKRISTITKSRKGILPLQLREAVLHELGYDLEDEGDEVEEDVPRMFSKRTLTTTPPAACVVSNDIKKQKAQRRRQLFAEMYGRAESREDPAAAAENDLQVDETLYKLDLLLELETLLDIVAKTNNFISVPRSEGAWNEAIYSRILELALTDHPEVKVENVTRANIAKPFQPSTRPQTGPRGPSQRRYPRLRGHTAARDLQPVKL
ncbi:hypothetical protein NUW58_g10880 [Xylaria curta]|uniref:Uncharacterized protein n=1 Tax=Xylaria curta TaxID=42375 RepID=A0ACC1MER4_9PEZI|nr:hypothetical protein NUW58_g10880 [Xylaria curta]